MIWNLNEVNNTAGFITDWNLTPYDRQIIWMKVKLRKCGFDPIHKEHARTPDATARTWNIRGGLALVSCHIFRWILLMGSIACLGDRVESSKLGMFYHPWYDISSMQYNLLDACDVTDFYVGEKSKMREKGFQPFFSLPHQNKGLLFSHAFVLFFFKKRYTLLVN